MTTDRGFIPGEWIRRVVTATMLAIAAGVFAPSIALAVASSGTVAIGTPDYSEGTLTFVSTYPTGTTTTVFSAGGSSFSTIAVDPAAASTAVSGPYRLSATTVITASGRAGDGSVLWTATTTADPANHTPGTVGIRTPYAGVVHDRWNFSANVSRPATHVHVSTYHGDRWYDGAVTLSAGVASALVTDVPAGSSFIDVVVSNGFGPAPKVRWRVSNLGTGNPSNWRYLLVDKQSFWMYLVEGKRVMKQYPVAVGMSSTQTPTGLFKMSGIQYMGSSSPWGTLRRRLFRRTSSGYVGTSYYIHGTNDPSSIGTMASHGCVRMYNWHVTAFAKRVPNGTIVRIR